MSKSKPILFSAPMVNAILDGRKTQTRRVVKDQGSIEFDGDGFVWAHNSKLGHPCDYSCTSGPYDMCPYGQPGDFLWVRETHAIVPRTAYRMSDGVQQIINPDDNHDAAIFKSNWDRSPPGRWRPSIHMPRWASRLTLEITDVHVERLNDISADDAHAEGVQAWIETFNQSSSYHENGQLQAYPVTAFSRLWQSINGPDSWDANPWVWCISFKAHKTNIDQLTGATP